MTSDTIYDPKVEAAIAALDRKIDAGLIDVARLVRTVNEHSVPVMDPRAAGKDDVAAVGRRIDALTARINILSERIAATGPRLSNAETMITDLRSGSATRLETEGIDRRLRQLSKRVDVVDQRENTRAAGLSNQMSGWLVSLLLLVVGAMVTYALVGH